MSKPIPRARTTARPEPGTRRPPYAWAGAAAAAVALLYVATLAPTAAFWDASEYIATARILGIPHPPGNPLFVLLARTWHVLLEPFGLSTAVRINLFSVLMSAAGHGIWFLVVHRALEFAGGPRAFRLAGAFAAILVSATAFTVWNQSNVNEKVYTVSFFTIALLSWLAFRWRDNLGAGRDDNLLLLMAFLLALSVGNHLMAFLAAPALLVFICVVRPQALLHFRLYPAILVAAVLGLSIHLFLPVRAAQEPLINEAAPTCESLGGAVTSIVTYGNSGCEELSSALKREQYQKPPVGIRQAPLSAQAQNWFQYFDWQWARGLDGDDSLFGGSRTLVTVLFILLGILGLTEHWRRDPKSAAYMTTLFVVLSAGLTYYLNFKYGYSIPAPDPDTLDKHEVRERDYFFIVGFSVWGLAAGIGVATLWRRAYEALAGRLAWAHGRAMLASMPVLGVALVPLVLNFDRASRSNDYSARDWAYNLLMSVEPYGLIFTNGDNDTFPLWYLQEVEGVRRDVTVAVTSYLNTPWYVTQLRALTRPCAPNQDPAADPTRIICQRPYSPGTTGAMYTHDPALAEAAGQVPLVLSEPIRQPTRSIFPESWTDEQILGTAMSYPIFDSTTYVPLGPVTARLGANTRLWPWHQFVLWAIRQSIEDRPVYFASAVATPSALGLTGHVVRQGAAFRLWPNPGGAAENSDLHHVEDASLRAVAGEWVDVERTRALLEDVFVHRGGLPDDWEFWPDRPSSGIANYYGYAYIALYSAANAQGDAATARQMLSRYEAWAKLGIS